VPAGAVQHMAEVPADSRSANWLPEQRGRIPCGTSSSAPDQRDPPNGGRSLDSEMRDGQRSERVRTGFIMDNSNYPRIGPLLLHRNAISSKRRICGNRICRVTGRVLRAPKCLFCNGFPFTASADNPTGALRLSLLAQGWRRDLRVCGNRSPTMS
jgi:hypothetical protein